MSTHPENTHSENAGSADADSENARSENTALVTGAGRGFGRAIATALSRTGLNVVGIGRDRSRLAEVQAELGGSFTPVVADAADPAVADRLITEHRPRILVLNAGAAPVSVPLQQHTWETFSRNWHVDVQQAFHWARRALLSPLAPGSTVVTVSSGAALRGSPLSGGYAGAKATIRFLTSYAAAESDRDRLGIRFVSLLPTLTPATELGLGGATAYAAREGVDVETFLAARGPALTLEQVGISILDLIADTGHDAYLLGPSGLTPIE
jgi:NAD(P)-dependent dehydrogenase (short-subunit alcohol dehydrogenase family)